MREIDSLIGKALKEFRDIGSNPTLFLFYFATEETEEASKVVRKTRKTSSTENKIHSKGAGSK